MRIYPILLSKKAIEDIGRLKKENPKYPSKVWELISDIFNNPNDGIGQPEALKGDLSGWWSRRITGKHRMIYRIRNNHLEIASCFGHYYDH
ncbi:Txe/YoeB family addiction module toxin [Pontibacter sp. G13]|uniref:Txe/YoeB family addiction module toxin n=1 Tax=Pontibacter sp. G13 TaxID=3074898 RepID=UPI00288BD667|nr:Txe/YoeB family addiction module toxin [Pontibacter sp. G13]WNJ20732.1 Txe/YoeB family addiction module toxin [Pontibacter sp. G13]